MTNGLLITLPKHDTVTEYLSQFSKEILDEAAFRKIPVRKLSQKEAVKSTFEKSITKLDYKMIVFNGHGSDESIAGHNNEALVTAGVNESFLHNRITYARSCSSATILGMKAIAHGQDTCFIGYDLLFQFYTDTQWELTPLRDKIARLYLEPSNLVPLSILKGNTALEAHENSKRHLLKNINKVLRTKDGESFLLAEALWNNYIGQQLLGTPTASLSQ